jgi:muramidase (phage lysozyme)
MITFEYKNKTRAGEYVHVLEGDFLQQAKEYLYAVFSDEFQDAVNIEILHDGETVGGNPGSTHVDAGARI